MKRSRRLAPLLTCLSLMAALVMGPVLSAAAASPGEAAIAAKHAQIAASIGAPTGPTHCTLRDGGCYRGFERGQIHWSPSTGAHPTYGAIGEAWGARGWENGLGYPTTDEQCRLRHGGCYQGFERGQIHWSPASGPHATFGAIGATWASTRWEQGFLGYPTGEETCAEGRCHQVFQGGTIRWSGARGSSFDWNASVDCNLLACVALTFDDGPSANADRLRGVLTGLGVPATFFLIGSNVPGRPAAVRALKAARLPVENHTWSHPQMPRLTLTQQRREVTRTDDALAAAGVARSTLMRPPYGEWNANTRRLGKPVIMWSVDPRDWDGRTTAQIRNHIAANVRSGSIVLMHDRVNATVAAVPGIVADLRARGLTPVTVKQLVPGMRPGDVVYSRTQITRAGSASTEAAPTIALPDGGHGPVVDAAPHR